jgi:uncharacterized repeat protein (TIGR01451 family)/CSLREA domain-containing protein
MKPRSAGRHWLRSHLCAAIAAAACAGAGQSARGATFVVDTTADDPDFSLADGVCAIGPPPAACSLRAAIEQANAAPDADLIQFSLCPGHQPGTCSASIVLTDVLPALATNMTVDGFSDPASRPNSLAVGSDAIYSVQILTGSPNGAALTISGDNILVRGLTISCGSCSDYGVYVTGSINEVKGNQIGTDIAGRNARGFGWGVAIEGDDNLIGGPDPADRNLISGNALANVQVFGSLLPGGIRPSGNQIRNNYLGSDATGSATLQPPHGTLDAVVIIGGDGNVVGGLPADPGTPGPRNVIVDAAHSGILIDGGTGNVIQHNFVGVGADGATALGNGWYGIYLRDEASSNRIGAVLPDAGNTIANNELDGVQVGLVSTDQSAGNSILSNAIFDNGFYKAIDLTNSGTPNADDPGDADTGPNDLQNSPVITNVRHGATAADITAELQLSSTPLGTFTVQLFASRACNPFGSGQGDGEILLKTQENSAADGNGLVFWSLVATLPTDLASNVTHPILAATVTDAGGNTSEFSTCFDSTAAGPGTLGFARPSYAVQEGQVATIAVARDNGTTGAVSVHYATVDGTAIGGNDYPVTSGTLSFADGATAQSFTISIPNDLVANGDRDFRVVLSSPTGGATLTPGADETTVTIEDDDGALRITDSFGDATDGLMVFGALVPGDTSSGTVTLLNSGTVPITVASIAPLDPSAPFQIENSTCGVLDVAQSCTFDVVFAPLGVGTFSTDIAVDWSPPAGKRSLITVAGAGSTDTPLALTKTVDHNSVSVGDTITYTLDVYNGGPATARGVVVSDTLPAELGAPSALSATLGSASYDSGSRAVTWDVGDVPDRTHVALNIETAIDNGRGVVTNTAVITAGDGQDPSLLDNQSSVDIAVDTPTADLKVSVPEFIAVSFLDKEPSGGFTATVENAGPSDALDVVMTISAVSMRFSQVPRECQSLTNPTRAICDIGTLQAGASRSFSVGGHIDAANSSYSAEATSSTLDLLPDDNFAQGTIVETFAIPHGGCSATIAASGSYLEPKLGKLRQFRDRWLRTNRPGRAFVAWYYEKSPPVAAYLARHTWARIAARLALTPVVYGICYPGTSLLLISLAAAAVLTRHRRPWLKLPAPAKTPADGRRTSPAFAT